MKTSSSYFKSIILRLLFLLPTVAALILSSRAWSHELGQIIKPRPAYSVESHEQILKLFEIPSADGTEMRRYPRSYQLMESLLASLAAAADLNVSTVGAPLPALRISQVGLERFSDTARYESGLIQVSPCVLIQLESEEDLAAVLAHELAHYSLAHDEQRLFELLTGVSANDNQFQALGRFLMAEIAADATAMEILSAVGYPASAALSAVTRLLPPASLEAQFRVREIAKEIEGHRYPLPNVTSNGTAFENAKAEVQALGLACPLT